MSLRHAAVCSMVLGSTVLPLLAPVALQYEGGAAPVAVLAGVQLLSLGVAGLLATSARRQPAPRVDFGEATA